MILIRVGHAAVSHIKLGIHDRGRSSTRIRESIHAEIRTDLYQRESMWIREKKKKSLKDMKCNGFSMHIYNLQRLFVEYELQLTPILK